MVWHHYDRSGTFSDRVSAVQISCLGSGVGIEVDQEAPILKRLLVDVRWMAIMESTCHSLKSTQRTSFDVEAFGLFELCDTDDVSNLSVERHLFF